MQYEMVKEKLTPGQWAVLGALTLGVFSLGASFTAFARMDVNGRLILPNPAQGYFVLVIAIATLVATVVIAVKNLGTSEGLKMIGREAWPALIFGGGIGALVCFFLRAVFFGIAFYIAFIVVYLILVYLAMWLAKKSPMV